MGFGSWFKKKVWKPILDPLLPDETIRGLGRMARGNFREGLSDLKTGTIDGARGAALVLGGAGLAGAGPLGGTLGGVGGKVFGAGKTLGGMVGGGGGEGGGMSGLDKWGLALSGLGTAAGVYGDYQSGKREDRDFGEGTRRWDLEYGRQTGLDAEDKRRWDTDFGEGTRRWDLDFGENKRRWDTDFGEDTRRWDLSRADERGDIEWGRDFTKRKGQAFSPMLGSYLSRRY